MKSIHNQSEYITDLEYGVKVWRGFAWFLTFLLCIAVVVILWFRGRCDDFERNYDQLNSDYQALQRQAEGTPDFPKYSRVLPKEKKDKYGGAFHVWQEIK